MKIPITVGDVGGGYANKEEGTGGKPPERSRKMKAGSGRKHFLGM